MNVRYHEDTNSLFFRVVGGEYQHSGGVSAAAYPA